MLHNGNFLGTTASDFLAQGYDCVPRAEWLRRYSTTVLPNGAHFWYKGDDGLWWLGKISASTTAKGVCLVRFLDDPGPIKLPLPPARYTTSTGAVRGSWCPQVHLARAFARGVQRNVDESRGAAVDSWFSHQRLRPIVFRLSGFRDLDFSYRLVLAFSEFWAGFLGVPACFVLPTPPA